MESSLPLGITLDVTYLEASLEISEQALSILSDGVVEATNLKGELFGFDRSRKFRGKTAPEIADAARAWGQNDDITVVTVRRRA
jgi:serine phosphatase RsbU (regulator of sigma subunit)